MITPKRSCVHSFVRVCRYYGAAAGLALGLSACASMQSNDPSVAYEYKEGSGFVRVENIEPGAPDNAHPFTVSQYGLRQLLAKLKVKGTLSADPKPVFTDAELDEFIPHLVSALAKAGPKQDVTFASAGMHGYFGVFSPKSMTTARMFVHDQRLNLIIGVAHERDVGEGWSTTAGAAQQLTPGSRARRVELGWSLDFAGAQLASDKRSDWVTFNVDTIPAAAPAAPGATPSVDSRYREIDDKLKVLDQLKANGRITEEEYREQRRKILQGI